MDALYDAQWIGTPEARAFVGGDHQRIALRLASPKRAAPGRIIADQADAGHLPLFVAANEPRLL